MAFDDEVLGVETLDVVGTCHCDLGEECVTDIFLTPIVLHIDNEVLLLECYLLFFVPFMLLAFDLTI